MDVIRILIPLYLMGYFTTPADEKLYTGHIVHFRRNCFSEDHGYSHIQMFENALLTNVIGHVSGVLGTEGNSEYFDCDILSEIIDCYSYEGAPHKCAISFELTENTTHRVGGSKMNARLSCSLEDVEFFVEFLNNRNKSFVLV